MWISLFTWKVINKHAAPQSSNLSSSLWFALVETSGCCSCDVRIVLSLLNTPILIKPKKPPHVLAKNYSFFLKWGVFNKQICFQNDKLRNYMVNGISVSGSCTSTWEKPFYSLENGNPDCMLLEKLNGTCLRSNFDRLGNQPFNKNVIILT